MQIFKRVTSKISVVPFTFRILTILVYFIPFIFDEADGGESELIWFVYIIPAFIFSYYWGIWGGIVTAFISAMTQTSWELVLSHIESEEYNQENYLVIITTAAISFGIAIGIGILADKLKNKQKTIEKINLELQCKNKQLDYLSHMDELTGLWNRRGLLKLANEWRQCDKLELQNFSVLFIDLDKFKPVNDTYGHQIGDQLLQDVAMRLKNCVNEHAIISRLGGDEFTVLLPNANESYSIQMAKKMIIELSKMFSIEGKVIFITPSIGISLSSSDENDVESLLQKADIAMYFVKRKGKNNYSVFNQSMKDFSEKQIQMENQLRKALEKNELLLYYQPQINVRTGQVEGFEALIRWQSNGRLISPSEFIPIAEETGLILPIGQWVIETACRQNKAWLDAGYPCLSISVNVSSYQFQQPNFVQFVLKVLKETQLEPKLLKLELTESVLLGNEKTTISKFEQLKQLGIQLSIDDFGSGFSSLTYVMNFPIDEIKLDKSFIDQNPFKVKDKSLIQTMIKLGHILDTKVVAEGVETEEQFSFLKEADCDIIQGYLIGKPAPVEEIEKYFKSSMI